MRTRFLFIVFLFVVALPARADDWPRFRGPNGTGVSADRNIPVEWTDRNVLFRVEIPGTGHSSPIVVGKRLFLLSATEGKRLVLCHDAITGKKVWSRSIPGATAPKHPKSSFASATPCSDGRRLYCSFWDGKKVTLHAYSLEGEPLWTINLGRFTSQHGPGFSPIVVDSKVIVNKDQDKAAVLQAFDARTGNLVWQAQRPPYRSCYSTPFLRGQGKDRQIVVASTGGVTAYTLGGKQVWNHEWTFSGKPLRTVGSPIQADGMVFACAGDGDGSRDMIALRAGTTDTKPSLLWHKEKRKSTPYVPTLVAHEGHLYGVNDFGNVQCYEAKSGKMLWDKRLCGPVSASPILIDGKVYVVDERNSAFVFAADPQSLRVLAKNDVGEEVYATPAVSNGRLYVRGAKHLICIGKPAK